MDVNKPLKDFVKRRCEDFKLNQFFNSNISQNVVIQSPTRDNAIMDVVEFLKNDKSGISGWKKIVFLNKDFDYSLKRKNANEKEINLQSAIDKVCNDDEIRSILYTYFSIDESDIYTDDYEEYVVEYIYFKYPFT